MLVTCVSRRVPNHGFNRTSPLHPFHLTNMFSPFAFVIGSSSPLSASSSHIRTPYTPRHSSPLAPIPSSSSPIEAAKARRRAQYKTGPSARMCPPVDIRLSSPQTASRMLLKEKFRARCQARLKKAQERAAKRTPWMSSSDGFECEDEGMDDEDENPDDDLDDEVRHILRSFTFFADLLCLAFPACHDARCSENEPQI